MGCFDSGSQETVQKVELPKWARKFGKENVNLADMLAQRPYTPYPYARIAPTSQDQSTAFDMLRSFAPSAQSGGDAARSAFEQALSTPGGSHTSPRLIDAIGGPGEAAGTVEDYMSPYLDQVLDTGVRKIGEESARQMNDVDAAATMSGAFGDARHGVMAGQQQQRTQETVGDYTGQVMDRAYSDAMGRRESDLNRALDTFRANTGAQESALDRMLRGGAQGYDQTMDYIGQLSRSGMTQEGKTQQSLDLAYQDFLRQMGYPEEMLNLRLGALGQTPMGQTTTSSTPTASPAASALSSMSTLAGMFLGM